MKRLLLLALVVLSVPLPVLGQALQGPESAKSGTMLDPKAILHEAAEWAARVEDRMGQAGLWSRIGKEQIKLGDRKAAADSFQRAFDASNTLEGDAKAQSLGFLVEQQAQAGEISVALDTAEALSKLPSKSNLRAMSRGTIAAAQAQAGDIQGAMTNVRNIDEPDGDFWKAFALEEIAQALVKAGDIISGVKTAQSIPVMHLRVRCLASIALLRYQTDKPDGRKILQEAVEAAKEGGENDRGFLEVEIIRAQAGMGEFEEALRLAKQFSEPEGFQAAEALYYVAAEQAKAKDVSGALKTARAISIRSQYKRDLALRDVASAQSPTDALKTLQDVSSDSVRAEGLLAIARQEVGAKLNRDAEETFREVYRIAERFTTPRDVRDAKLRVLHDLARTQGQTGFGEAARRWIDQQVSAEVRAAALVGLAQGLTGR